MLSAERRPGTGCVYKTHLTERYPHNIMHPLLQTYSFTKKHNSDVEMTNLTRFIVMKSTFDLDCNEESKGLEIFVPVNNFVFF